MAAGWLGFVDDAGKFSLDDREGFAAWVKKFAGQEVVLTVKRKVNSVNQARRYYRGIVVPDIAAASGYTDPDDFQEVHEALAWKFLRLPDSQFGTPRRQSTSDAGMLGGDGKLTMSEYIDKVIIFAETSIPGCKIRRTDEVTEDDYEEWEGED